MRADDCDIVCRGELVRHIPTGRLGTITWCDAEFGVFDIAFLDGHPAAICCGHSDFEWVDLITAIAGL